MEAPKFPLDVSGKVRGPADSNTLEAVMVTRSSGGGGLFFTKEAGSTFDVWIETLEEVDEELKRLRVEWPAGSHDL